MLGRDFICAPFATVLVSKIVLKCNRNAKEDSLVPLNVACASTCPIII